MNQAKSIKSVAKEAKLRLKNRFWEEYKKEVDSGIKVAEEEGLKVSGVKNYFKNLVIKSLRGASEEDEEFYLRVKEMLDCEGARPSNALDRLMDKKEFYSLCYAQRERYLFRLSEKYLSACERYDRERNFERVLGK